MQMHHVMRKLGAGLVLLVGLCAGATHAAGQVVSIQGKTVNMRSAPSPHAQVLWQLGSGYPLQVTGRKGSWLHVVDFEGDKGWVARRLTSTTPHAIVKARRANLRSGPGTGYRLLGQAAYGDVMRVLDKRPSWVKVKADDGRRGWMARSLLWGD